MVYAGISPSIGVVVVSVSGNAVSVTETVVVVVVHAIVTEVTNAPVKHGLVVTVQVDMEPVSAGNWGFVQITVVAYVSIGGAVSIGGLSVPPP